MSVSQQRVGLPSVASARRRSDTLAHGVDYIATRPIIAKTFGDPEGKVERKERVPDWSIDLFRKACVALKSDGFPAVSDKLQKTAIGIGLSYMLQVVQFHGATSPSPRVPMIHMRENYY